MLHFLQRCIILATLLLLFSVPAAGEGERLLYIGTCQLSQDPDEENTFAYHPSFCIQGNAHAEGMVSTEHDNPIHELIDGSAYIGAYYSVLLSLHSKIDYRLIHFPSTDSVQKDYWQRRYFFLQIGNPVITRWRLTLGSIALPFAINLNILPDALNAFVKKSERFFPDPVYGLSVAFQDLMGSQVEFGQGDNSSLPRVTADGKNKIFSVRAIKDISALHGVRFSASALQAPNDNREISLGMFNISQTHALTAIEWTRLGKNVAGILNKADQLIRFQYADDPAANKRWLFEYEDEFSNYWLTSIGYEKSFIYSCKTKLSTIISYYKSRDPARHSHMIITLGYGGEL